MKNKTSFFAETGMLLAPKQAEHIMRMATTLADEMMERISERNYFDCLLVTADGETTGSLERGSSAQVLEGTIGEVERVINLKHLADHISLALKEKERQTKAVNNLTLDDYCRNKGYKLELTKLDDWLMQKGVSDLPSYNEQNVNTEPDMEELEMMLDLKTLANLLSMRATAAAIGQCIHPEGTFAAAREALMNCQSTPNSLAAVGNVAVKYSSRPSVDLADVDDVYFGLQARHRELEAGINRIKSTLRLKEREKQLSIIEENKKALNEHIEIENRKKVAVEEYQKLRTAYISRKDQLNHEMEDWKEKELNRIAELMVSVPTHLEETLKTITV